MKRIVLLPLVLVATSSLLQATTPPAAVPDSASGIGLLLVGLAALGLLMRKKSK